MPVAPAVEPEVGEGAADEGADNDADDATVMSPVDDDATVISARVRAPQWVLAVVGGAEYPLPAVGSVDLGRASRGRSRAEGHLYLKDPTRTMSKTHARLRREGESWFVTDLFSTNGTAVRARDGRRTILTAGEEIAVEGTLELGDLEAELRRADGGE